MDIYKKLTSTERSKKLYLLNIYRRTMKKELKEALQALPRLVDREQKL